MRTIDEKKLLSLLSAAKDVLLLEPTTGTYIPLGLAKVSSYVKSKGGRVAYRAGIDSPDLVAITTLFTYDAKSYCETIMRVASLGVPVVVGGVCASLAPRLLEGGSRGVFGTDEVSLFKGYSPALDQQPPDYSIDWGERKGWEKHSYVFTTRGCPNKCAYCAVPRLEKTNGRVIVTPNWREHVAPDRRTCVVLDNNITFAPPGHLEDVVNFLVENDKTVIFENGIDCKHVTKENAKLLAKVKWAGNGLRIAFDRISEDGTFQRAVRTLLDAGVGPRKIMSYVLFNFLDNPKDAEYRLLECARLGVQPYPQRFSPLDQPDRKAVYVGKHWTKRLGQCFQHFGIMGKFRVKGSKDDFVSFREFARRPDIRDRFKLSGRDLGALADDAQAPSRSPYSLPTTRSSKSLTAAPSDRK